MMKISETYFVVRLVLQSNEIEGIHPIPTRVILTGDGRHYDLLFHIVLLND